MRFISSYQGSATYEHNGYIWEHRYFADPQASVTPISKAEQLAMVGCVKGYHDDNFFHFPPADVMAHFPGAVGARWSNEGQWRAEYDGPKPTLTLDKFGHWIVELPASIAV